MKARPLKNRRFAHVKVARNHKASAKGLKSKKDRYRVSIKRREATSSIGVMTMEDQRGFVWEKRLEGHSQADIAKALQITQSRVSQILAEAYAMKRAARTESTEDIIEMELERVDRMIFAWWKRASKEERASEVYLKWVERRHKVLGIDISRTELSGRGGGPLHITASNIDITKLNDEELEWLEKIWKKAGPKLPEDVKKPKALIRSE
jgi:predicted transcriptional regulator